MKPLVITGGHVVTPTEQRIADLVVSGAKVSSIGDSPIGQDCEFLDASGCWVTPGLIDLQVNGSAACNFWGDPTIEDVLNISAQMARAGVTTILPTLITGDIDHLARNSDFLVKNFKVGTEQASPDFSMAQVEESVGRQTPGQNGSSRRLVRMPGLHFEGPCLSPQRPGVHPQEFLQPLTMDVVKRLNVPGLRLITLAPEMDPSLQTVQYLREHDVVVALGHSNATLEQADAAFDAGIRMMTHTFNALPPLHHREPGAVAAALLDDRVSCCLIADGLHLSPATVKLIVKTKGVSRSILVTDIAYIGTTQGGLAGSSILLNEAVVNVVKWGVCDFPAAVRMASLNAARAVGIDSSVGSLAPGKFADVVLWDKETLEIKHTIIDGRIVF